MTDVRCWTVVWLDVEFGMLDDVVGVDLAFVVRCWLLFLFVGW